MDATLSIISSSLFLCSVQLRASYPDHSGRLRAMQCLATTETHNNTPHHRTQAVRGRCLDAIATCFLNQHNRPHQIIEARQHGNMFPPIKHDDSNPATVCIPMGILHITVEFLLLRIDILFILTVCYLSDTYC
jgi:hypothetical protein